MKSDVSAISITDHDTIDGVKELFNLSLNGGPEWVTGVEISCEPPEPFKHFGSIHLLGYGFSIYDRELNALLDTAKTARRDRNPKIIKKLNELGIDIDKAAEFWTIFVATYIEGAKDQVGEELAKKFADEGRDMQLKDAIKYALDFSRD